MHSTGTVRPQKAQINWLTAGEFASLALGGREGLIPSGRIMARDQS
jgi:hypothetical protein